MRGRTLVFPLLAAAFVGAAALSLSVGPVQLSLGQVFSAITGGSAGGVSGETAARVVLTLRLPRILLGVLVGGA
ncbi:MAG: iron ABC transporter permease, partial [Deltaproteobacteria bacterium]